MDRSNATAFKRLFFTMFSFVIIYALSALPAPVYAGGEREITLEEAYHSALRNNERVLSSGYRVDQAKEDVRIARSPMMPQVHLQGRSIRFKETIDPRSVSPRGTYDTYDHYNEASLKASQVLFQGGKLKSGWDSSRYAAESSEFEDYRTRQQILYTVSNSFYNVLFARRSTEIAENQLARSNEYLELARQRRDVGLVDMTAVLRAQVQVAAALEAIEEAENNYTISMERLALEMGISTPPASLKEPETIEMQDATAVEGYIDAAFNNRRDLMASEKGLLAVQKQADAQRADYYPSLSLEGTYSRVDEEAVYGPDKYNWQAALVASYPLFSGLRDTAEIAKAKAEESEMQASVNRIKQEIRLDVRSAYADIQTRKKMVQHLKDQVDSAQANYKQVSAKFEEGLASTVDVVDAQTALNEAELSLANVYYSLQLDHLRLKLATGLFLEGMLE